MKTDSSRIGRLDVHANYRGLGLILACYLRGNVAKIKTRASRYDWMHVIV